MSEYGDIWVSDVDDSPIAKGSFPATAWTDPDPKLVMTADVYKHYKLPNETGESGKSLVFAEGQVIRTSQRDALYAAATVASVAPNTGAQAGGTAVVITGTNFHGATGVTFGGTAGTAFSVVDDTTIQVTTPAHAAGAVSVVVADDSGNVTDAGAFTYV